MKDILGKVLATSDFQPTGTDDSLKRFDLLHWKDLAYGDVAMLVEEPSKFVQFIWDTVSTKSIHTDYAVELTHLLWKLSYLIALVGCLGGGAVSNQRVHYTLFRVNTHTFGGVKRPTDILYAVFGATFNLQYWFIC